MFDPFSKLALGLFTGIVFGFLLQKGRVAKFPIIVGQFLLRDWTVAKIMGIAVVVGAIGVYALVGIDAASLHVKPALIAGLILGGVLFGFGMVLLGYCPGTSVAACGEGHRDAMVGVAGMLVGTFAFVLLYRGLDPVIRACGDLGKVTLPEITGTSPWLWVAAMALAAVSFTFWFGRRHIRTSVEGRRESFLGSIRRSA